MCPFLAEGQSGFVGSRYGSTWVVAGERKAERRENRRIGRGGRGEYPACAEENSRETQKSRKKRRSILAYTSRSSAEVNAPRAHTDVRRVFTAHDPPSRRATHVFLITLITKSRLLAVLPWCFGVPREAPRCNATLTESNENGGPRIALGELDSVICGAFV